MEAATRRHRLLIQEGWEAYRDLLPPDAPAMQVEGVRVGFYGGALAMAKAIIRDLSLSGRATAEDHAMLDGLRKEVAAVADDLEAGRA